MARSTATTVVDYLDSLPDERRAIVAAVRDVVLKHLPTGYRETMNWGMISYEIPLERHPPAANGQPLIYAALAAQKNYYAIYLMGVYSEGQTSSWFADEFRAAGKKLDMGKSCVRFRTLEDLPLATIGKAIGATSVDELIALHDRARAGAASRKPRAAGTKGKAASKTTKAVRKKPKTAGRTTKAPGKKTKAASGKRKASS